jgi:hypothetical protein
MAIDQLQNSPRQQECPAVLVPLNNQTAAVRYDACSPAVIPLSQSQAAFATDGTVFRSGPGSYRYVVGDAGGTVYEYQFDQSSPGGRLRWPPIALGGSVSGPPLPLGNNLALVPVRQPTAVADSGRCGFASRCVALLDGDALQCYMAAGADITTSPAASPSISGVVYIADQAGNLVAYDSSTDADRPCAQIGRFTPLVPASMLAGPVVLPGNGNQDHLYVVTTSGGMTFLLHYTAARNPDTGRIVLTQVGPDLPLLSVSGTASMSAQTLRAPTRLAISFASGSVAMVQVNSRFGTSLVDRRALGTALTAAPYWWHGPGGADLIGVGGQNGALFVLDAGLGRVGTYPAGGPAIIGSPTADAAGDWFFGAADGLLYELLPAPALTPAARFGYATSSVQSSPRFDSCPAGTCIYLAKMNGTAFLVPLVDRDVAMTACITTQPPACSGINPRLWAHVTVGSATNPISGTSPQTVRMLGYSYFAQ